MGTHVRKFHARVGTPWSSGGATATCKLPLDIQLFTMANVDPNLRNRLLQRLLCCPFQQ